jgi:CubicO group peptidase (beta-lactamase class C family)
MLHSITTLGLLSALAAVSAMPSFQESDKELDTRLEGIREKYKLVALAGARYERGKALRFGVVGLRRHRSKVAVTRSDRFHLGSCTKAMTATLLGLLVQDGKLRWDMTVVEGLPDLAEQIHKDFREVTLGMLLAHRSGLPNTVPKGWSLMRMHLLKGAMLDARREYVKALLSQEPLHAPGSKFFYSNAGYTVAASFAETATGKSWEELIRNRLFEPLGMKTAGFGAMGTKGKIDQPWQHRGTGRVISAIGPGPLSDNPKVMAPAGRVHASMEDWGKFLALHAVSPAKAKSLLKLETWTWLHTAWKGQTYAPGGWVVLQRPWAKGNVLTHTGSNTMNAAVVWMAPSQGRAFFAATNSFGRKEFVALDKLVSSLIVQSTREK